jgi:hypothetical protein
MAHPRKLIRAAIVNALKAADTAAGERVFKSRATPWRTVELPGISVFAAEELVDEGSEESAPRELLRGADFNLDLVVAMPADGDVDDALDDLAEQVEAAMHADPTFGETASDCFLVSSTFGEVAEGNRPMGALRLVYRTRYITHAPESTELVPLQKVGATYDLGGAQHPDDQAEDLVTGLDQ